MPAAAVAVYAVALLLEHYGVRSSVHGADVSLYATDAHAVAAGRLPYRDLYFEYPPGALAALLPPEPASDYATVFKALMAVLGAGALAAAAVVLRAQGRRTLAPLLAIAVAPLAVGSVFVNRFDVWPALLTVVALAFLVRDRPNVALALLGLGAVTKVYPAVAVPAALVWIWRERGAAGVRRAVAAFVGTALVVLLPFAALGPGGLRYSFTVQLTRHLETESLGGTILLVADRLGLYHATVANADPGSLDVFGRLPDALGTLSILVVVAAVLASAWTLRRGPLEVERLVAAVAAAVVAYVAFGKVLSPQYLVWLVPLVPLVARRAGAAATGLLLAALVLTQVEFDHRWHELSAIGPVVWILLARDLALVALAGTLLAYLRATQTSKPSLLSSRYPALLKSGRTRTAVEPADGNT